MLRITVRQLTDADKPAFKAVMAYSYNASPGLIQGMFDVLPDKPMLGAFADGKLAAGLMDWRFDVRLEGRPVKSNGIGMVASAPETRRHGLVREMLTAHLVELREQGVVLSLLYPFVVAFYERLGWGLSGRSLRVRIPPERLARYGRETGVVRQLAFAEPTVFEPAPGETFESVAARLDAVYEAETKGLNLSARREAPAWQRMLKVRRGRRYVFGWQDAAGKTHGYAILTLQGEEMPAEVYVREIFARRPEAWRGLCHFLSCHDSQTTRFLIELPREHPLIDLAGLAQEEATISRGVMARAVDVAGLLAARGAVGGADGECTILLADALAPWNQGLWKVGCWGGRVQAERISSAGLPVAGRPDLEMEVSVLSQLIVGAWSLDAALAFGLAKGEAGPGLDFARGFFPRRPILHLEYY